MLKNVTVLAILMLLLSMGIVQGQIDTVSIYDLQYVEDPATDDLSPYLGDTVVVKGLVLNGPRDLWIGNRWSVHIVDPDSQGRPWNSFFVVQDDTFETQTLFQFVETGYICYFTGVVSEFNNYSQMNLFSSSFAPDPVIVVDILSTENGFPEPMVVTAADMQERTTAEPFESMWVRVENVTIVNNDLPGDFASFTDATEELSYLGDYFNWIRDGLDDGTYSWPPAGTRVTVDGFVRDESADVGTVYNINPRNDEDLLILTTPPVIGDVLRNPGVPTSEDDVTVSTTITDDGTVDSAVVQYSVDWGPFMVVEMGNEGESYAEQIPMQPAGSFVRYFVYSSDDEGFGTSLPADTSVAIYSYVVRDDGLSIFDVQYTWGYSDDASPYEGYEVEVTGVVTTDSTDFEGDYYIQDKDSAWSGIRVNDDSHTFDAGDLVRVVGTVQENFGLTRLNPVTSAVVEQTGQAFAPVLVTTGQIDTAGEEYESVLIRMENLTVTDEFPDTGPFGEFVVDDGSGGVRIDDDSDAFDGNRFEIVYANNDPIGAIVGMGSYSFGNYKVFPRDTADVIDHVSGLIGFEQRMPDDFSLDQNYPNPFNPNTRITYSINKPGFYTLTVYNILGQQVIRLVGQSHQSGTYTASWTGIDQAGRLVGSGIYFYSLEGEGLHLSRKMILIK